MSRVTAEVNSTLWRDAWMQLRFAREPAGCTYLHTDKGERCHVFRAVGEPDLVRVAIGSDRLLDIAAHTNPFEAQDQIQALEKRCAAILRQLERVRLVLEQLGAATHN